MTYSHGGTCSFCGTEVDADFCVCKGCGAKWQEKNAILQMLAGFLAFGAVAWGIAIVGNIIGSGGMALVGIFLCVIWGGSFLRPQWPLAEQKLASGGIGECLWVI